MPSRSLARGVVLAALSVLFGIGALRLPIGRLSHAGAGLFPLLVSGLLLVLALVMIARSAVAGSDPLYLNLKNIAVILCGLAGFVVCCRQLGMAAGIVWLVFVAALAGTAYSWRRNLVVSLALGAVALAFQRFLGLDLRLF